ncbi:hypothetical protein GCM10007938_39800 [Vibrio zhanjiangensis]|uniref:Uncharacterized protein n=1 Tax=Vibrio zhanjiangensis TaxID=1046128 RepID=A0ABQ6F3V4_9VIBR|nr:hypothetical protein [Vibrio zhanjiangensis]GLT20197.1 hypothetical protein GCM10007938_39800 [Vibrio zhanjiangensis]
MGNVHNYLPRLTVNQLLISDLMDAPAPCFALGYVTEGKQKSGFIAVRPESPIPSRVTQQGMNFGHSVLGTDQYKVLHFAFEFYGHTIYHGLVPAGNPIVQAVISTMLETEDYFFFAINPDHTVTTFRSRLENHNLSGLRTNQALFGNDSCSLKQYESAVESFAKKQDHPGTIMTWVCRNNWDYLDLEKYPLDLNPSP